VRAFPTGSAWSADRSGGGGAASPRVLALWVQITTASLPALAKGTSNDEPYAIWRNSAGFSYALNWHHNGFSCNAVLGGPILSSFFHHVVGTYDRATGVVRVYWDGKVANECSYSDPLHASTEPLVMGASLGGTDEFFEAKIDDVRIYDRAL
jgi:hypothetical protein